MKNLQILIASLTIVLLVAGATRFIGAGFLPATRGLNGDFGATFPADYAARLRPDFPQHNVWDAGSGQWHYGPLTHFATLPLLLSPSWAAVPLTWAVANTLFLGVALLLVVRGNLVDPLPGRLATAAIAGLWLLYQPVANSVAQGTIEILELLIVVAALHLLHRNLEWRSGVLLGAAAMVKFLPIGFLGWAILKRRWKCVVAAAGSVAVIAILTAFTLGWGNSVALRLLRAGWSDAQLTMEELSITSMFQHHVATYSREAVTRRWFPYVRRASGIQAGMVASFALALVYGVLFARRRERTINRDEVGALFLLMFLLPPWNHDYYFVFALVPISQLFLTAVAERDRLIGSLVIVGYLLISPPIPYSLINSTSWFALPFGDVMNWYGLPMFGALVLLFATTVRLVGRELKRPSRGI